EKEDRAARAYDLAALKYWGVNATTNFPKENYIRELEEMQNMSRQELIASLRRGRAVASLGVHPCTEVSQGTTNMDAGRQELVVLQATRTCTWGLSRRKKKLRRHTTSQRSSSGATTPSPTSSPAGTTWRRSPAAIFRSMGGG
uniref:AP2/ERF domain-containing protein n=1 Tax=Aegilops tauschii subsp. strangulata TaxID=200361 RepID=A0A453I7W7_AEGTS